MEILNLIFIALAMGALVSVIGGSMLALLMGLFNLNNWVNESNWPHWCKNIFHASMIVLVISSLIFLLLIPVPKPAPKPTTLNQAIGARVPNSSIDPNGSAAVREGFNFIGCEMDEGYLGIARARIENEQEKLNEKDH